jgi:hypothetical protein
LAFAKRFRETAEATGDAGCFCRASRIGHSWSLKTTMPAPWRPGMRCRRSICCARHA